MNQRLAQEYSTVPAEDLEKAAEAQLFLKLATENGIDLNQLTDDQIETLYSETFKTAEESPFPPKDEEKKDEDDKDEEKEEEEKKEAAARELAAAQEWQDDQIKADFLGRKMAHAMVHELNLIGEATNGGAPAPTAPAEKLAAAAAKMKTTVKVASGHKALDELALKAAVKLASASGFDSDEAAARVGAVFTLGLIANAESKTASATTVDQATEIRALEYLEAAGYPVSWGE